VYGFDEKLKQNDEMRTESDISGRSRVRAKLRSLRQNTRYPAARLDTSVTGVYYQTLT